MNPEMIHDALTLLSNDLILPVDKLRSRPRKAPIPWTRWASVAACLVLLIYGGFLFQTRFVGRNAKLETTSIAAPQQPDAPAEAPAAAAPAIDEVPDAEEAPAEEAPAKEAPAAASGMHRHSFAEETEAAKDSSGYCGNTQVTLHTEDGIHTLSGSDAIAITDILIHLNYDPSLVCRCAGEFTVDTETLLGVEISLTEGFARCELGQANLTKSQAQLLWDILNSLP